MKKILMTLCIALVTIGASAQKGEQNVGAHILYGIDAGNIGFGVKYQNNVTDVIRLEAVGDYYLKADGLSMFDVNVNGHYLFPLSDKVIAYPLVGINYTKWTEKSLISYGSEYVEDNEVDVDGVGIGLNIGGGIQYKLTDKIRIGAELKFQTVAVSTFVIGAGLTFTL